MQATPVGVFGLSGSPPLLSLCSRVPPDASKAHGEGTALHNQRRPTAHLAGQQDELSPIHLRLIRNLDDLHHTLIFVVKNMTMQNKSTQKVGVSRLNRQRLTLGDH